MIQCKNGRSGFAGSVQDWSLGRHGDPKNAYGIEVDARIKVTYMYNIYGLYDICMVCCIC